MTAAILCWLSRRARSGDAGDRRPGWRTRHVAGCRRCRDLEARIARVEEGLRLAREARPDPPPEITARVLVAWAAERRQAPRRGLVFLPRLAWLVPGLTLAILVGTLAAERIAALRPPPRTVRFVLPAGVGPAAEARVRIHRADGSVEVR